MAAPPPRAGDEKLPDWEEEGRGESSSSPPCYGDYLDEVQRRVLERLRRTGRHEYLEPSALADLLRRMPPRYHADIDADDKVEDVLLHLRILEDCADPDKRPVFYPRHVKSITLPAGYNGNNEQPERLMEALSLERKAVYDNHSNRITSHSGRVIHLHEIIFGSLDRPKLLCRLSALLDEVGLHIREGHLYCTVDGFCLAMFLVDGWKTEETLGLVGKIYEALALKNQFGPTISSTSEKMLGLKLNGAHANKGGNIAS